MYYRRVKQSRKKSVASRLSNLTNTAYHGYCADWSEAGDEEYPVVATDLLDFDNPLYDFKAKMGKTYNADGKTKDRKIPRHVLHIAPPTPGKFYYQKAYWWSIFESHWFDFSCAIPERRYSLRDTQPNAYHARQKHGRGKINRKPCKLNNYVSSTVTNHGKVSVPEWGATDANRVTSIGGSDSFGRASIIFPNVAATGRRHLNENAAR